MRGKHIVLVLSVLTLGLGGGASAYWYAAGETGATAHTATLAQWEAEEEARDLIQKLGEQTKAREAAERAREEVQAELYDAKARMQTLNARLQQEKEAAESARMKAEAEARAAGNAKLLAEAEAQAATQRLALEIKTRETAAKTAQAERWALLNRRRRMAMRRAAQLIKARRVYWQPMPPVRKRNQQAIAWTARPYAARDWR